MKDDCVKACVVGPGNDGGRWNLDSILKFVFVFVFSQRPAAQPFHNGGAKMGNKSGFKPVFISFINANV
jgi:hypothetical protein